MRVVWLCHFANQQMKNYFNSSKLKEFAPWINNLLELFKDTPEIELHVVAPNVFSNKDLSLIKDGITYHFYKYTFIPQDNLFLKNVGSILHLENRTNFSFIKQKIETIITKVNPDIIHLHGAENPYYSAGILTLINKYPTITTIQGFIRNTLIINKQIRQRIHIEEEIIKKSIHFGTRTNEMSKIIFNINPSAILHFHNYPITFPTVVKDKNTYSDFDIVFFSRVTKDKGIEDLLNAVLIIKNAKPDISLHIIGAVSKSYKKYLVNIIREYKIEENVHLIGFMPTQNDIYKQCLKAKVSVLPTYHDILPGTIIESMLMKIPVVAYAVGGIPDINIHNENIILVEKQNVHKLAEKILLLLNDEKKRNQLSEEAYNYAIRKFDNNLVKEDILIAYHKILRSCEKYNCTLKNAQY
jgi:glycosyltransferase involved in cell wall biosynthesis